MQERKKFGRRGIATGGEKVKAPAGRGRSAGKVQGKSRAMAVPAGDKKVAAAPPQPCPECGKMFRTDAAVQTHRHAAHGTAAMVVGDMLRCSECGSLVKGSQMAKHKRRMHGIV